MKLLFIVFMLDEEEMELLASMNFRLNSFSCCIKTSYFILG